jgi:uncharacterized protein YbjT (DUF2867 family)
MKVLVLGATGGTGRLIVRDALAKGHSVIALVRSNARAFDLPGADMIEDDARDEGALIAETDDDPPPRSLPASTRIKVRRLDADSRHR